MESKYFNLMEYLIEQITIGKLIKRRFKNGKKEELVCLL